MLTIQEPLLNESKNSIDNNLLSSQPPLPPLVSCIAAIVFTNLIFMCFFFDEPPFVPLIVLLVLFFMYAYLRTFVLHAQHEFEPFAIEMGEKTYDKRGTLEILGRFLRILVGRGSQRQQVLEKSLRMSGVCFGRQDEATRSAGFCVNCGICKQDFKKGEECLACPVCSHIFHLICIKCWLEKNLTCPLCSHCMLCAASASKN